jgi:hypothetical protein
MYVDGPMPTTEQILSDTDLVLRGRIGKIESHLSQDGLDIFTTYQLINPQVAFSSKPRVQRPGESTVVSFTQHGGTVPIGGFKATLSYDDTAKIATGMEVVALLHDVGGTLVPAAGVAVFQVRDEVIVPLSRRAGAHKAFAGKEVGAFLTDVTRQRQRLLVVK